MTSFYFFGELGYLHQIVLAYIERFCRNHPEKKNTITLYTFEGYEIFIEKIAPSFFLFVLEPLYDPSRGCYGSPIDLKYQHIQHISAMLDEAFPKGLIHINHLEDDMQKYYISKPLSTHENTLLKEKIKCYKKKVVFFFRKRVVDVKRNFTYTEKMKQYLLRYFEDQTTLCMVYATKSEWCLPDFVDESNINLHFLDDIEESIYAFQNCDEFITNHSGMEDFAKNCNTKEITVFPDNEGKVFVCSLKFRPFATNVNIYGKNTRIYYFTNDVYGEYTPDEVVD